MPSSQASRADPEPAWGAVAALTLCVSTLIASEFMPVSLLTPIASSLRLSEGAAGQAISVSGLFAVITSLAIASLTRGIDRRHLLLGLTLVMIVAGLLVAFAPNFPVFLTGRALIGVAIGGFWSMSTAIVMRLVPLREVPRALALLNGGNALATTVAAPLGSFLGQYIGWRGAFFLVVPLGCATFAWQYRSLPVMPPQNQDRARHALPMLGRPGVALGMSAIALLFMGQFALFTYLRPYLEHNVRLSVSQLSLTLLVMGGAGVLGTWLIGRLIARSLVLALVGGPVAMAGVALALVGGAGIPLAVAGLLAVWGLVGTAMPVAWGTWLSQTLPDDAEAGGGLMVAVIQLAITLGAAGGGMLFDLGGPVSTFCTSAMLLAASALVACGLVKARARDRRQPEAPHAC